MLTKEEFLKSNGGWLSKQSITESDCIGCDAYNKLKNK